MCRTGKIDAFFFCHLYKETGIYYTKNRLLFDFKEFSTKKDDKTLTRTIQPLSRVAIEKAEKPGKTKTEEVKCDILAVCDSLNKLCNALTRLEDYAIKNMETDIKDVCHHEKRQISKMSITIKGRSV